jgi:hypothetical protein
LEKISNVDQQKIPSIRNKYTIITT